MSTQVPTHLLNSICPDSSQRAPVRGSIAPPPTPAEWGPRHPPQAPWGRRPQPDSTLPDGGSWGPELPWSGHQLPVGGVGARLGEASSWRATRPATWTAGEGRILGLGQAPPKLVGGIGFRARKYALFDSILVYMCRSRTYDILA